MALNFLLVRKDGRIEVRFDFDRKVVDSIRKIPGRLWIDERKVWNLPGDEASIEVLKKIFGKCVVRMLEKDERYSGIVQEHSLRKIAG